MDAARYSAKHVLASGKSLALVPGGATEALHCKPDVDIVYLKKRRGFVKLALETGASLVPVYSFNENNTFNLTENKMLDGFKKKFQAIFGISFPLVTNVIPKSAPITVVVGAPISCPKMEEPSDENVVKYLVRCTYIECGTRFVCWVGRCLEGGLRLGNFEVTDGVLRARIFVGTGYPHPVPSLSLSVAPYYPIHADVRAILMTSRVFLT